MNELIAILRGVRPDEVAEIGEAVVAGGIGLVEVPLNSPDPLTSIATLKSRLAGRAKVGAGTVLTVQDVQACHQVGAQLIVSPNCDPQVIAAAVKLGMACYPGVATVSEAFSAIRAGARNLKLFPANVLGIASLRAWREVLPSGTALLPVGGMDAETVRPWAAAGAAGAGFGGSLYKAGRSPEDVQRRTRELVAAWHSGLADRLG